MDFVILLAIVSIGWMFSAVIIALALRLHQLMLREMREETSNLAKERIAALRILRDELVAEQTNSQ